MSTKQRCPECSQSLGINLMNCLCGWKAAKSTGQTKDHRCQFEIRGRRCPLFGTISQSPYGNGIWYCCEHWRNLGDPLLCEAILINAEKNYEKIMNDRIDWRRKLFPEDFKIIKSTIKKETL